MHSAPKLMRAGDSPALYLGAVGDRYGRKRLLLLGAALCIPFSILSSLAHDGQWLVLVLWKHPQRCDTGVGGNTAIIIRYFT